MRIIGGDLKGKTIMPPAGFSARPTTDFAKEGLFNILTNMLDFDQISVLDLFSGTGSISYEFASRGCPDIISCEMNPLHANFIKKTAAQYGMKSIKVLRQNVFDFIQICNVKFDLIFADPPYDMDRFASIPEKVLNADLLKEGGIFIMEHPAAFKFDSIPSFVKEKKYGNVHFSFFEKK